MKRKNKKFNSWDRYYTYGVSDGSNGRRLWVEKRSGNDGIGWDVLQHIKNQVLGIEVICIEVFPAEPNVVNEINRRHLWEVSEGFLETAKIGLHIRGR